MRITLARANAKKTVSLSAKAFIALVVMIGVFPRLSLAEPGLDILEIHSVKAVAVTKTLSDSQIDGLVDGFKAIAILELLSPPPSKIGDLPLATLSVAQTLADGDEQGRRLQLCGSVPEDELADCFANATIFSAAYDRVDVLLELYELFNGADDLRMYLGLNPFWPIDFRVFNKGIVNGTSLSVSRSMHFANKKGINLTLAEEDAFPASLDLISAVNFRDMGARTRSVLKLVSPETGAVYEVVYSIYKDRGRWAQIPSAVKIWSGDLLEPVPFELRYDPNQYDVRLKNPDSATRPGGSTNSSGTFIRSITAQSTPIQWGANYTEQQQIFSLKYDITLQPGYINTGVDKTGDCLWVPADQGPTLGAPTLEYWGFTTGTQCVVTLTARLDSDGDGIGDNVDLCPDTEPRQPGDGFDGNGCAESQRDGDDDGVNDSIDICTATPANTQVNTQGCADRDGDGAADLEDSFPDNAQESSDSDGDGIGDNSDGFPMAVTLARDNGLIITTTPQLENSSCSLRAFAREPVEVSPPLGKVVFEVLAAFSLGGCSLGEVESVGVSIDFGVELPEDAVAYKYSALDGWKPIPGAIVSGSVVSYIVTDNGALDTNSILGEIDDPVTVLSNAISKPIPVMPYWLVGLMVILLAGISSRHPKQG